MLWTTIKVTRQLAVSSYVLCMPFCMAYMKTIGVNSNLAPFLLVVPGGTGVFDSLSS
jgi:hypothetical protein